jgi:hypothetical protein
MKNGKFWTGKPKEVMNQIFIAINMTEPDLSVHESKVYIFLLS